MKTTYKLTHGIGFKSFCVAFGAILFGACSNDSEKLSLGQLPNADFEVVIGPDGNSVQLINKTNVPSIAYWTVESTGQKLTGDTANLRFTFEGSYDITLLAAAQGGMATTTKGVTISQNDPTACNADKLLGFIAGCTEKTWKLNPEAGTFKVGPGPDDGSWWSSGAGEVADRACEFNDEYTFVFDAEGTFIYDNKGDFYADGYLGSGTHGCEPNSNLPAAQQAWASGEFRFTVTENAGVNGLGQLQLVGAGAHIGLQKVHNGGETESGPAGNSITYDVLEMTHDVNGEGYDMLKVGVNIGDEAWWTFTLRSN